MDIVAQAAAKFGSSAALITRERTLSFIDCDAETARIANALFCAGIRQGDMVAMVAPNSPTLLLVLMALLRIGAVAAPVNYRFPAQHVEGVLHRLAPRMVLFEPSVDRLQHGLPAMAIQRLVGLAAHQPLTPTFPLPKGTEHPVTIIHTSASSGLPKAAMHSFGNHWHNAAGANMNMPFVAGDCWLLSLPLYHIGGYALLFRSLLGGGCLAVGLPDEQLDKALSVFPLTHLSLVATQLYRLLRLPEARALLQQLKAILLGGSAIPEPLLDDAVKAGLRVYLSYGSTEMGSQIATSPDPLQAVSRESGAVLPWRVVQLSEEGEILVRGECLFMGYLSGGELRPSRDRDGWFHTCDAGALSESGTLTIFGRKDNMFISGGENIHPEEIEHALTSIAGIEEALVVPVPDREYGLRPLAFIRTTTACEPDEATIRAEITAMVGRLKAPASFVCIPAWVSIAGSGKIDRGWYRRLAASGCQAPV